MGDNEGGVGSRNKQREIQGTKDLGKNAEKPGKGGWMDGELAQDKEKGVESGRRGWCYSTSTSHVT